VCNDAQQLTTTAALIAVKQRHCVCAIWQQLVLSFEGIQGVLCVGWQHL